MTIKTPKWQNELMNFKGIKSLLVLEGNINDIYPAVLPSAQNTSTQDNTNQASGANAPGTQGGPSEPQQNVTFLNCGNLLRYCFEDSYKLVYYNPIDRFANMNNDSQTSALLTATDKVISDMEKNGSSQNADSSRGRMRQQGQQGPSDLERDMLRIRTMLTHRIVPDGKGKQNQAVDQSAAQDPSQNAGSSQDLSQDASAAQPTSQNTGTVGTAPGAESSQEKPLAIVIDMASRMLVSPDMLERENVRVFSNLQIAARDAIRPDGNNINTMIFLVNNLRDLPEWFVSSNADLRSIVIPKPDRDTRKAYIELGFPNLSDTPDEPGEKSKMESFIDKTDGMCLKELDEIRRMYARGDAATGDQDSSSNQDDAGDPSALVDIYKYGLQENMWATMREKLENDPVGIIKRRVKGQDQAVNKVVQVLKRSAIGLSGATHSSSAKPKGVLFLSGPTGTGKTEIVKAVTELLFGDERSMLRFDMSEYQSENSDQKLFGAPPGYVGYNEGGQLTNAVRANPFSVILFDEIEKAHPSIMDKFLQILEDGRMTDGQGNTVYFSESIIFFTSNIGFTEERYDPSGRHVTDHVTLIPPDLPYDEICKKVQEAMNRNFKPEFLGRIGNNIVVFDYINDETARAITAARVEQVNKIVRRQLDVEVEESEEVMEFLVKKATEGPVKEKGGRGIGNLVESDYLNVLSDFVFDSQCPAGSRVVPIIKDDKVSFEMRG
ncbi:MAG: AAA family ATPase [Coriobacteriales bacterium]|jgi:MoxR-like ATPase